MTGRGRSGAAARGHQCRRHPGSTGRPDSADKDGLQIRGRYYGPFLFSELRVFFFNS